MQNVYLDHQSATPLLPEALEAMSPFFVEAFGNPSSLHHHGMRAREAMMRARAQIAALINADSPEEIYFTSDGAESANLAVKGAAYANRRRGNHIVLSEIEHPAILNSVEFLEQHGFTSTRVKVDACGFIAPEAVRAAITGRTILVCAHHANHDIGTMQPVREIAAVAAEHGIAFYVDAETSAGWTPIDVQAMGANLVSFSPHRFYGPKGVGVLYRNKRARITNVLHGGVQEQGLRAGVENVPAIVGAGVASEIAARQLENRAAHTAALQKRLWNGLQRAVSYIRLNGPGPGPDRIGTSLNVSAEFTEGEGQLLLCDVNGIAIASGTSCVSKALKVSHVLRAIGLDYNLAQASVILSLGKDNTEREMDYVVDTFAKVIDKLRGMSPLWDDFRCGIADSVIEPRAVMMKGSE